MNAVPFDTLKLARGLEAAGMSPVSASTMAHALAEAMTDADIATKGDMTLLRTELKGDIAQFRSEVAGQFALVDGEFAKVRLEIAAARSETKSDTAALRADLKADIAGLRSDSKAAIAGLATSIELLRRDMTIKLGSLIFLAAGLIVAAMRLLPPAHF